MSRRLEGQTAWISGAASGIGEAVARLFAAEGANVALVDVQAERGRRPWPRRSLRRAARPCSSPADVGVEDEVRRARSTQAVAAVRRPAASWSTVRGSSTSGRCTSTTEAEWDRLMGVNVKSIFFSVKHALRTCDATPRSYVVNVGSISSFVGQAATPAYTASKAAVLGLSRSIALDYAADRPAVQLRLPGHHRHADAARAPGQDARPRGHAGRPPPPRADCGRR